MTFEEKITKLLDQAEEAKKKGDFSMAVEKYLKVAEIYFAEGERTEVLETAERCYKYGKAFKRAAQIITENNI